MYFAQYETIDMYSTLVPIVSYTLSGDSQRVPGYTPPYKSLATLHTVE